MAKCSIVNSKEKLIVEKGACSFLVMDQGMTSVLLIFFPFFFFLFFFFLFVLFLRPSWLSLLHTHSTSDAKRGKLLGLHQLKPDDVRTERKHSLQPATESPRVSSPKSQSITPRLTISSSLVPKLSPSARRESKSAESERRRKSKGSNSSFVGDDG